MHQSDQPTEPLEVLLPGGLSARLKPLVLSAPLGLALLSSSAVGAHTGLHGSSCRRPELNG